MAPRRLELDFVQHILNLPDAGHLDGRASTLNLVRLGYKVTETDGILGSSGVGSSGVAKRGIVPEM